MASGTPWSVPLAELVKPRVGRVYALERGGEMLDVTTMHRIERE